jgi:hypothetical protein
MSFTLLGHPENWKAIIVLLSLLKSYKEIWERTAYCAQMRFATEFVQVFFARISSLSTQNAFVQHNNDLIPNLVGGLCADLPV